MNMRVRISLSIFLVTLTVAQPLAAFDYPLSDTDIREAYFLGKANPAKRDKFLAKYSQQPPMPEQGPHVAMIEFETPFVLVVDRASQAVPNYFAPDAEQEFLGKPALCGLEVRIDLTDSYGPIVSSTSGAAQLRPPDFWRDFKIRLIQGKEIQPKEIHGSPIYEYGDGSAVLAGAQLEILYDAEKLDSGPATVEVLSPDGNKVTATFDLAGLR